MAAGIVPGAQLHQQDLRIALQQGTALLHEAGPVKFPVILQMEDEGRLHPCISLIDQLDLTHPRTGAEVVGAEPGANRGGIGIAILGHQDARHPAFGFLRAETVQGAGQKIVAVARGHDHGNVGGLLHESGESTLRGQKGARQPMPAQTLLARGLALHQRGQLREAEALYRQALAGTPEDFGALNMLGVLKGQTGAAAEGLVWLERALALQPRHVGALVNYANILSLLGRCRDAVTAYDRALAIRPDAESFANRGFALQSLNQPAEALASFEQALALEPRNVQALYRRGVMLNELGRTDEALATYDRLLAMAPGHVEA